MPGRKIKSGAIQKKPASANADRSPKTDNEALTEFCANVSIEEISFKNWKNFHRELNLLIPCFLKKNEAESGCEKHVTWIRSVKKDPSQRGNVSEKQKVVQVITFPPNTCDGYTFIFPDLGDQCGNNIGIARIVVKIVV